MESQIFKIDAVDRSIIELVQQDPSLTHTQIAKQVNRSQPTVGMRIRKLEKAGVLKFQAGINLRTVDLQIGYVYLNTNNPGAIEHLVKKCPYMLNGFRQSGIFNFTILLAGYTLKKLDKIVNNHFRDNPEINQVELNIITNIINDFVLPFNVDLDHCENGCKDHCCGKCYE